MLSCIMDTKLSKFLPANFTHESRFRSFRCSSLPIESGRPKIQKALLYYGFYQIVPIYHIPVRLEQSHKFSFFSFWSSPIVFGSSGRFDVSMDTTDSKFGALCSSCKVQRPQLTHLRFPRRSTHLLLLLLHPI